MSQLYISRGREGGWSDHPHWLHPRFEKMYIICSEVEREKLFRMKNLIFQNSYFPSRVLPSLGKFPGCATVHRPPCNCGSVLCLEFRGIQCLVVQVMLQSCRNVIVFINDWKQLIHSCMFNIFCNPLQISLQNFDHTLIMYFLFQEEKTDAGLKKKTLPLECIFEATLKGKKKTVKAEEIET